MMQLSGLTHPTLLNSLLVEGVHRAPQWTQRPLGPLHGSGLGCGRGQHLWRQWTVAGRGGDR